MSYNHLPVYLKPCFLYMGVFKENSAVRVSRLVKLWVSEGFLKPVSGKSLETAARDYLNDLVDRNLVLIHEFGSIGNIKYCKIHDLLRDVCWREAGKEGFYDVIGQHKSPSRRQRRVFIRGSTSKEEADDDLKSMPLARSFLCDRNRVVSFPESRMLRILHAYDRGTSGSQYYELDDLFGFVNLRFLAVGVQFGISRQSSPSIGLVWNLQTLIISKSSWIPAPVEIWKMSQLRHVEFNKGRLELPRAPSGNVVIMENIQTLKGLHYLDREEEFDLFPNIKKLEVEELPPTLKHLTKLESCRGWRLYCLRECSFPYSLKKLSLGSHSHWGMFMNAGWLEQIGALPLLQKLKLERAEFEEWETREGHFPSLKYLELNWCHLKSWVTDSSHFPRLEQLHLYGSKELEEIPCEIGEIATLQSFHLKYCSEAVVESAKKIAEEQEELRVQVVLFNTDDNKALRSLTSPNFVVEIVDCY